MVNASGPAVGYEDSYYASTCNDQTRYAELTDQVSCDVCVVGGGFTGLSTAISLAERGYAVTLLEQNLIGWGASGRNGGQLINGMTGQDGASRFWNGERDGDLFDLGYRGHSIIAERVERFGINCDLKFGYLDVATRRSHLRQQKAWYEEHCAHSLEAQARLLDRDETAALIGTDIYHGALMTDRNGHLHPLNLCMGEARAAVQLGVALYERSPVMQIQHGARPRVVTPSGSVTADFVVLAGNAYQSLDMAALDGYMLPATTYMLATEPLTPEEAARINSGDLAVCDQSAVPDYFRLSSDRRLLFGGCCDYIPGRWSTARARLVQRMRRVYPELGEKRIEFSWGGRIAVVPNGVPLLGRAKPNVYYALGYSGHGVNMAHACGELVAQAVSGTLESMDILASVPHQRMPGGRRLAGRLLSFTSLWRQFRNRLPGGAVPLSRE